MWHVEHVLTSAPRVQSPAMTSLSSTQENASTAVHASTSAPPQQSSDCKTAVVQPRHFPFHQFLTGMNPRLGFYP